MRMVKTVINDAGEKEDVILGHLMPFDLIAMGQKEKAYEIESSRIESPGRAAAKAAQAKKADSRTTQVSASAEPENEDTKLAREQSRMGQTEETPKKEPGRLTKLYNRLTGKKPPEKKNDHEEFLEDDPTTPSDTPRLDVDTPSWTPTLLRAPLPSTIIDELRGKYSKFRTRHDPEFVKRMQRIDSDRRLQERRVKAGSGLLDTPRQEAVLRSQARRRDEQVKRGALDDKALEGIGRLMWERGMRLNSSQEIDLRRNLMKQSRRQLTEDTKAGEVESR